MIPSPAASPISPAPSAPPADSLPNSAAPSSSPGLLGRIAASAKKTLADFENSCWPIISETRKLAKNVMKGITILTPTLKGKLDPIMSRIGVFSLVSLLFTIKNIPSDLAAIVKNIKLKDGEGSVLSFLNFIIGQIDGFDCLITAWQAFESFGVLPAVTAFSLVALPFAFILLGYSALSNAYKSVWNWVELHRIAKNTDDKQPDELYGYLKGKVGITQAERESAAAALEAQGLEGDAFDSALQKEIDRLKEVKRNTLARHTDQRVVNIMRHLKHQLKHSDGAEAQPDTVQTSLRDIKKIVAINGVLNGASSLSSVALISAIGASLATPAAPIVAPVCGGVRSVISLGKHVVQKFAIDKLLDNPRYAKPYAKAAQAA